MILKVNIIVIAVLLVGITVSGQVHVHEGLEVKDYPWRMHALDYPRTPGGDSVVVAIYDEVWYFNVDSLCYYMVTDRRSVYTEDLVHYYYWEVLDYASEKQIEEGYRKIKAAAKKYKSTLLNDEADYMKIHAQFYSKLNSGGVTDNEAEAAVREMHEYIKRFIFKNDKARHLEYLAEPYNMYRDVGNYARMFNYIPRIVDLLKQINPKDYLSFYYLYYHIGSDYYNFRDYERAVFFLKKALHDKPTHFADRSDLRARLVLAKYYAEINQLDSSDYYYRSLYDDTNTVRFRPIYDIYAATGIAKNLIRRGMHREAMPLLERWLPEAIKERNRLNVFDIYIAMGECFLAGKQPHRVKEMIDSVNALIQQYRDAYFPKEKFFELMLHYSMETGQTDMAYRYADSMQLARNIHEKRTDAMIILRSEQEVHEAEIILKNELLQTRKNKLQMAVLIIILISLALYVSLYFNRQRQKAYKGLFQRIKEQDRLTNELQQATLGNITERKQQQTNSRQQRLVEAMRKYMLSNMHVSLNDIDRDTLAVALSTNRTVLADAIKKATGKTLMEYASFLRLEEARKIIDKHHELSINAIAEECGLSARTFYRLFKEQYKISPAEYRKLAKKN
jgi:AraC-like DNA-binding protein